MKWHVELSKGWRRADFAFFRVFEYPKRFDTWAWGDGNASTVLG